MKTLRFSGLVCVALAMFVLPAAAQTPDGVTPANEGICDPLADATPGLQGLCVAMCEAQDCEAELDPNTGEVVFDPSCSPSSEQLLGNYNNIVDRNSVERAERNEEPDPPMPCVKTACQCWTKVQLDNLGDSSSSSSDRCFLLGEDFALLQTVGGDWALASDDSSEGLTCVKIVNATSTYMERSLNTTEFGTCLETVKDECNSRGLP